MFQNMAAKMKKAKGPKGKATHQLAEPMPQGLLLTDNAKKQWKLGKPIGAGGFGVIYLATRSDNPKEEYVIKLEPHSNGPLFCELAFYMRAAKPDMIKTWMSTHKIKHMGMPQYIASGSHEKSSNKYRFMVMEKFGSDLQKLFEQNGKSFPAHTVFNLGSKILSTLQYIHSKDYTHADIKASNLLLSLHDNEVYLVDYGLAFRYLVDGKHKEYKEDPKRCHDGTVEFTSIDAHKGVAPSRRGDLEILGYCMLQWLCGKLPWETNLEDKNFVMNQKIKYSKDIPGLMKKCLPSGNKYAELENFFKYAFKLGYTDEPDYNYCRKLFSDAVKKCGGKTDGKLDFGRSKTPGKAVSSAKRRRSASHDALASDHTPKSKAPRKTNSTPGPASPKKPAQKKRATTPKTKAKKAVTTPKSTPRANGVSRLGKMPVPVGPFPSTSASKKAAKPKSVTRVVKDNATQTSPGLKGLPRSRKPRSKFD